MMVIPQKISTSNVAPGPTAASAGKVKAMVYVPEGMQAAVRMLAARRACRISDVYVEAVAAYLAALEAPTPQAGNEGGGSADIEVIASLTKAIEQQGALVEELVDKVGSLAIADPAVVGPPPMLLDTAAWAVATVLRLLVNAGDDGATKLEVGEMGKTQRLRHGLVNALYSLRGVGLARNMGSRWWACWPPVQGDNAPFISGKHAEFHRQG